jgi:hypothetical protein
MAQDPSPSHDPRSTDQAAARPAPPGDRVDLSDDEAARAWREHFGVTLEQLEEAVRAAGDSPQAIRAHLLNQGASAGAG